MLSGKIIVSRCRDNFTLDIMINFKIFVTALILLSTTSCFDNRMNKSSKDRSGIRI